VKGLNEVTSFHISLQFFLPGALVFFPNSLLLTLWCLAERVMKVMEACLKVKELKSSVVTQCWVLKTEHCFVNTTDFLSEEKKYLECHCQVIFREKPLTNTANM